MALAELRDFLQPCRQSRKLAATPQSFDGA